MSANSPNKKTCASACCDCKCKTTSEPAAFPQSIQQAARAALDAAAVSDLDALGEAADRCDILLSDPRFSELPVAGRVAVLREIEAARLLLGTLRAKILQERANLTNLKETVRNSADAASPAIDLRA